MIIFYRILSIFINIIAVFFAISLAMTLPVLFSSPLNMLNGFLIVSIVLYAWFSNKFGKQVLGLQQPVKQNLRDWIRVNGIVAMIYSILGVLASVFLLFNPSFTKELMKNLPAEMPVQESDLNKLFVFMLVFSAILLVHVITTFYLVRKHKSFFQL